MSASERAVQYAVLGLLTLFGVGLALLPAVTIYALLR